MTQVQWLLLPAFIHVLLVCVVGIALSRSRFRAFRERTVKVKDVALDNLAWPEQSRKYANNFQNQFETPVLFYAVLALIVALGLVDWVFVALAWAFIATRVAHAIIHTGSNVILRRGQVFMLNITALMLMWGWLGLRFYVIG